MDVLENAVTEKNALVEAEAFPTDDRVTYKDSTYEIVSKVAYLIGVPKRIFDNEHEAPKIEIYEKLDADKTARIIRHLCIIRTAIERNFKHINERMKFSYLSISSMPEYVPQDSLQQLNADGISFIKKSSTKLSQHIVEINKLISDRINNCKKLFPLWLNWLYVKNLFLMPDGLKEEGTKAAADIYYAHLLFYPYQMYINWEPEDVGNLLYNDKKFVTLLYQMNGDYFTEYSKVSDAGSYIKGSIYEFIGSSEKVVVVVDCENSDPYKLCATLKNLDYQYTQKIASIILFDDVHSASAWRILDSFTHIPVEHMMTERVKQNKSLVDVMLIARTCQEHYKNNVDSFILAVKKGTATTGTASDPALVQGNLYEGAVERDYPLYRVKLSGLSIASVDQLFTVIPTIPDLKAQMAKDKAEINQSLAHLKNPAKGTKGILVNGGSPLTKDCLLVYTLKTTNKAQTGASFSLNGIKVGDLTTRTPNNVTEISGCIRAFKGDIVSTNVATAGGSAVVYAYITDTI